MNHESPQRDRESHRAAMQVLQADMDAKIAAAKEKRGLLIVHTGDGKGKSTAAFGMLARTVAHGRRGAVIQFIKSGADAVERALRGPSLRWHSVGDGFTWNTQDRATDVASCRAGWELALGYLQDPGTALLLLDELNVVLAYGYLPVADVLAGLAARPSGQHVVVTGRGAPAELVAQADLVTEMREVKHPFKSGVQAQAGIEF